MHYRAERRDLEVGAVVLLPLREKVAGEAGRMRGTKTRDGWFRKLTGKTGSHPSSDLAALGHPFSDRMRSFVDPQGEKGQ